MITLRVRAPNETDFQDIPLALTYSLREVEEEISKALDRREPAFLALLGDATPMEFSPFEYDVVSIISDMKGPSQPH